MQLHPIQYPVNSKYFADGIPLLNRLENQLPLPTSTFGRAQKDQNGHSIQRHRAHYLINALFGNTSIYSADRDGQKGKGHFQDYQGIAAELVLSMQISNQRGYLGHKRLSDIHWRTIHPNIFEVNHHSV